MSDYQGRVGGGSQVQVKTNVASVRVVAVGTVRRTDVGCIMTGLGIDWV